MQELVQLAMVDALVVGEAMQENVTAVQAAVVLMERTALVVPPALALFALQQEHAKDAARIDFFL